MAETPDSAAWRRLGEMLQQRRVELDPRYANMTLFEAERGINYRVAWDAEHGARTNFRRSTLRAIEVAYDLPPGTIDRILGSTPSQAPEPAYDWEAFGHALEQRRDDLNYGHRQRRRFRLDRAPLVPGEVPSDKTLARLEQGERNSYDPETAAAVEALYGLAPGTFWESARTGVLVTVDSPDPVAEALHAAIMELPGVTAPDKNILAALARFLRAERAAGTLGGAAPQVLPAGSGGRVAYQGRIYDVRPGERVEDVAAIFGDIVDGNAPASAESSEREDAQRAAG